MKGRSFFCRALGSWRGLRWVALAAVAPALWACNARSLDAPSVIPRSSALQDFQETQNRQLDLLFMIDNSSSMDTAQANLKANMASFMDVLKGIPGGLPDLHIAVVSSDLGAGLGDGSIQGCGSDVSPQGDAGLFHYQPTGGCAATGLDPNATYLVDSGGSNPITNFGTQDITTVFQCITSLGGSGCGFEHQLASVARALGADGAPAPAPNQGFLRDDADLGIVLLTNEDDCSAPPGTPLFTQISNDINSTYGPLENFLCNEWGHVCLDPTDNTYKPPARHAPNDLVTDTVTYSAAGGPNNCKSREDSPVMTPVGRIAEGIKALKQDGSQIFVATLAGPSVPYTVGWRDSGTQPPQLWPEIAHACGSDAAATSFADPAVRIQQFVDEFGDNGLTDTFCQASYGPSLGTIANKLDADIVPKCISGNVAHKPGDPDTLDCTVTRLSPNPGDRNHPIQSVVSMCDGGHTVTPCWVLAPPAGAQPCNGVVVTVDDGGNTPPGNTKTQVNCSICVPGYPDPDIGCN